MTRRLLLAAALSLIAQISTPANASDLVQSVVLENDVAYLRVGNVSKNLVDEIQSAQSAFGATNKIAGTILDLRFADGGEPNAAKMTDLFAAKKLPLAILMNGATRGAAVELAKGLRGAHSALIFGTPSGELKPDVLIPVSVVDEKDFLANPYGTLSTNGVRLASAGTNDFLPYIDHTSEADLVRARVKDGEEDDSVKSGRPAEPQAPFIRDPVLAHGVDFIKGLAVLRLSHS